MNFENYQSSYAYQYSEEPFIFNEFKMFSDKIAVVLQQTDNKIEQLKNHKHFDLMLIHFKKVISLIENIKIYHRINYQLIQLNISYVNESSIQ
jgi:hypothetical protein